MVIHVPIFKLVRKKAETELEEIPQTQQQPVVYVGGKPYKVLSVYGNTLVVQDLATGEVRTIARVPTP